jgi:cellulose synthase (UDP-forming)
MQIVLAFYTLGSFRWEVLMLAAVSFPIYISALWNAIAKKEQKWHVTGSKAKAKSPFNFMIPQVLVFVFLVLTSVVSIWRDLGNSQLSLATAWNVTNTFILGAFMIVALKENWHINHPPKNLVPDPVEHLADEDTVMLRTQVIVPPQLAAQLGVPELATDKFPAPTTDDDIEPHPAGAERAQTDSDAKEVAAK